MRTELYHLFTVHLIADVMTDALRYLHATREQLERRIKDRALKFVIAHFEDDDILYGLGDDNVLENENIDHKYADNEVNSTKDMDNEKPKPDGMLSCLMESTR